ncbi:hypothetical protein VMT65_31020 [Nocardia sp. CDC153]|uniref:hypothetical protein n=1 Tax=Nocardia sp. CDC153 TaxID=3112167 RepID=UPI002DBA75BA|nr:hypothetical protein [Nocardia sp. CDC153]MEC3957501.1 hypothetical protein [Nocardia sp. CDC153]
MGVGVVRRLLAGLGACAVAGAVVLGAPAIAHAHHPESVPTGAAAAPAPGSQANAPQTPVPSAAAAAQLAQTMLAAVEGVSPGSRVGVQVTDMTDGATLVGLNTDEQFYTASVVKLLIALDACNGQGWQPDSVTADQVSQMLSASDDDIADALWDADGGDDIVNRMIALIGLGETQAPADPDQWGETLTTPHDVVTIYRYITTVVPQPARGILLDALGNAGQIAADGTDQYFGIPDALHGDTWAIKQGWMTLDTSTTLDTTGLVGTDPAHPLRYAVVVMTSQPADVAWSTGGAALTAALTPLQSVLITA